MLGCHIFISKELCLVQPKDPQLMILYRLTVHCKPTEAILNEKESVIIQIQVLNTNTLSFSIHVDTNACIFPETTYRKSSSFCG